jgi:hypothetical protein
MPQVKIHLACFHFWSSIKNRGGSYPIWPMLLPSRVSARKMRPVSMFAPSIVFIPLLMNNSIRQVSISSSIPASASTAEPASRLAHPQPFTRSPQSLLNGETSSRSTPLFIRTGSGKMTPSIIEFICFRRLRKPFPNPFLMEVSPRVTTCGDTSIQGCLLSTIHFSSSTL